MQQCIVTILTLITSTACVKATDIAETNKATSLCALSSGAYSGSASVPFQSSLNSSAVVQSPMESEISGSMLLGNGDLNGILWIRKGKLRFTITKNDACDGRLHTATDPELVRIDVRNHRWTNPPRCSDPPSWSNPYPCPLICGHVEFGNTGKDPSIVNSRLDVGKAVGEITGADGRRIGARVLADKNVAIFETTDEVRLIPCTADFIPKSTTGVEDGIEWSLTQVPADEDWGGMSFALAHAVAGSRHVISVVTSLEDADPALAARKLAKEILIANSAPLIVSHEKVWKEFWCASGVELGDKYLEKLWYQNLYFLRSFSKRGVPPIGLYMGCSSDAMPWHGCATTDYNFEQAFWSAFSCNQLDLVEPYNQYMVDYIPRGKWFAKESYNLDGAFYPVNHFTHQIFDPAVCKSKNQHMNFYLPWTYVPGANGWQAHNVWLSYLYNLDIDYLKNKAYPLVKEMAIFYANFLEVCRKSPEGKAVYGPTFSPEHGGFGADDTPCDIAWTLFTLKAAIHGANTLDIDKELVRRWQDAMKLVPNYPLVPNVTPAIVADARGEKPETFNVPVPILPIFPCGEVTWWSPKEEKELFTRTLQTIQTSGYNSVMMLAGARARLSLPDAYEWIVREFKRRQMPSGFLQLLGDNRGNYSEQVAASGIIAEMLMQSVGDAANDPAQGIIRVFPAWPKDKEAAFTNLRAQGGFLVSAAQKSGKVVKLEVTATVDGKLKLLHPETNQIIEKWMRAGETRAIRSERLK